MIAKSSCHRNIVRKIDWHHIWLLCKFQIGEDLWYRRTVTLCLQACYEESKHWFPYWLLYLSEILTFPNGLWCINVSNILNVPCSQFTTTFCDVTSDWNPQFATKLGPLGRARSHTNIENSTDKKLYGRISLNTNKVWERRFGERIWRALSSQAIKGKWRKEETMWLM